MQGCKGAWSLCNLLRHDLPRHVDLSIRPLCCLPNRKTLVTGSQALIPVNRSPAASPPGRGGTTLNVGPKILSFRRVCSIFDWRFLTFWVAPVPPSSICVLFWSGHRSSNCLRLILPGNAFRLRLRLVFRDDRRGIEHCYWFCSRTMSENPACQL